MTAQVRLRGTIQRLFSSSPKFTAGIIRPAPGQEVSTETKFAGKAFVQVGELVTLVGEWTTHAQYGKQFKTTDIGFEENLDSAGLASWLAGHAAFAGIGPVRAKRIAESFGSDLANALRDRPEEVAAQARVPVDNVRRLATAWMEYDEENRVGCALVARGLSPSQAVSVFRRFGVGALKMLEQDPYQLLGHIDGMSFKRIDQMALAMGTLPSSPARLRAAVCHVLLERSYDDGSTCMFRADIQADVAEVLDITLTAMVEDAMNFLVEEGQKVVEEEDLNGQKVLALRPLWEDEREVARVLAQAGSDNPVYPADQADTFTVSGMCPDLDETQIQAVSLALSKRVTLITGGAGSGKSTVIATIAHLYRTRNLRVLLTAPTGRAARRLEEVTHGNFRAMTIHRALGYSGGRFTYGPMQPLEVDVAIIDEASMLDINLSASFFSAIGPDTAVVLVGDANQLPPVGPGALLRDGIKHNLLPVATLGKCHRQAGPLKANCAAILEGKLAPTVTLEGGKLGPWVVHPACHETADVRREVERLYKTILSEKFEFDPIRQVQFLSPTKKGPIGTLAINLMLQRVHQSSLGVTVEPQDSEDRPKLYVGDRVIQTRNNYDLDIMNGHQGYVTSVRPLTVSFDGEEIQIPRDCEGDIALAYCLTVHKTQGSEYPGIVTICHSTHGWMLHRNWIYTACTRARQVSITLGDDKGLRRAVQEVKSDSRKTLLPIFGAPVIVEERRDDQADRTDTLPD